MIAFKKVRGRVIPIRVSSGPDEAQKITHAQRARAYAKSKPLDRASGTFWKIAKRQSKETGARIAKRIARFRLKGIM